MCIAVYKPQGKKMPSKKIFNNCFTSNGDGAGFMFPVNNRVHYEKGFMTFSAFKKGLKCAIKRYGISTTSTPMVFHFRITSQGGVKPELTHPFPLSNDFDEMRKLKGDVDVACVHNGIIDFASSYSSVINYSDTMEFIQNVLYPLVHNTPNYYKNKSRMALIEYLLKSNRFAIMDGKGHVELIGDWQEDKGVYYSNSSYKDKPYTTFKTAGSYTGGFFSNYGNCGTGKSKYNYLTDDYDDLPLISREQENKFLETGQVFCDKDGEEMFLYYDYKRDAVIAYCYDCGAELMLTLKAENHAWLNNLVWVDDYEEEQKEYNEVAYAGGK